GVAIDVVPRLFEFLDGAQALDGVGGLPLLSIGVPQLGGASQTAKRALDVVVAGAAIVALAPLFALIAAAIKLTSRGPVFFRPRPLIHAEADHLVEDWHVRRLDLRPGITGLWQISGRSDVSFREMVRLDYQYVAGWSVARDIEILLATLPAVLGARGAY